MPETTIYPDCICCQGPQDVNCSDLPDVIFGTIVADGACANLDGMQLVFTRDPVPFTPTWFITACSGGTGPCACIHITDDGSFCFDEVPPGVPLLCPHLGVNIVWGSGTATNDGNGVVFPCYPNVNPFYVEMQFQMSGFPPEIPQCCIGTVLLILTE